MKKLSSKQSVSKVTNIGFFGEQVLNASQIVLFCMSTIFEAMKETNTYTHPLT